MVNKTWIIGSSKSCIQNCHVCPYRQNECDEIEKFEHELWSENLSLQVNNSAHYCVDSKSFVFATGFDE